jgi:UDP-N-acetylglucosamine 4,6-dehydratase/5-epimerase
MKNKTLLITGGTGSFGKAFISHIFQHHADVARVLVFSRDEQKQFHMANDPRFVQLPIEYKLGDVRDATRLMEVCKGVDVIIHSAAMKHVPAAEKNPFECIKTNVIGSQNVIEAALAHGVPQVVALSTDKAASPANMYGASKLSAEKLFVHANQRGATKFSVVRYGNVFGSNGSVVPFFMKKKNDAFLPITDPGMTRFSITLQDSIDLVLFALNEGWGGEVVVPIAASYRITDVASAVSEKSVQKTIGARPGEKLHEIMFSATDSAYTVKNGRYYVICPADGAWGVDDYCAKTGAEKVASGFEYCSGTNAEWLSVADIRALIASQLPAE